MVRDRKLIGYFCNVSPKGFIIISLRKEMAPVKAYSATSNLNPNLNEGLSDLIKDRMARIIISLEQRLDSLKNISESVTNDFLKNNYNSSWNELIGRRGEDSPAIFQPNFSIMNYSGGDTLLSTAWHQFDPYNRMTPDGNSCDHTLVGCVATATAQVMNYWSWPPYGVGTPYNDLYDWSNMRDVYNMNDPSITQAQINAVAEICSEVGQALESTYTCDSTKAYVVAEDHIDVKDVLQTNFHYTHDINSISRIDWNNQEWFDAIMGQINSNQPIVYGIEGHAIVCDGWQIVGNSKQYHMNYGWADADNNTWYKLESDSLGDQDIQVMQRDIRPIQGSNLANYYYKLTFPYRYFNVDASAKKINVVFSPGQNLQFLPTIKITGGKGVRFEGTRAEHIRLFTKGNINNGIVIKNGVVLLRGNGGIIFPR